MTIVTMEIEQWAAIALLSSYKKYFVPCQQYKKKTLVSV